MATAAVFGAPALALVGALAAACFVKVYGIVFLGAPRSDPAARSHEAGWAMKVPMIVLAVCCVLLGVAPILAAPLMDRMAAAWGGEAVGDLLVASAAPLSAISIMAGITIVLLLAGTALLLARGIRRAPSTVTWDCGYAAPSARMQYTSSSFAEMLVKLFGWALQPEVHSPKVERLFPSDAKFESHVDDTVLRKVVWPGTNFIARLFSYGRYLQQGSLQAYLMYILLVIVFLLLWR
jgi:hydrogenase-4 component B